MKELFAVSVDAIQAAYRNSGNDKGWRLLSSSAATLDGAEVAFIGLNPGGVEQSADHSVFAMDQGSAYVLEQWGGAAAGKSSLQRQVQALFRSLGVTPDKVLSGNLVPFRSPSWETLKNKSEAVAYGSDLWTSILARAQPRLVIGMGHVVNKELARILAAGDMKREPLGWGNITGMRATFTGGVFVGLPHLSRFSVIGRSQSENGLSALFAPDWN